MVKYSSPPLPDLFYHMQNTESAHRRKILNISLICTQSFVHIKLETWKACKISALCVVVSISISRGIPRPWASFIILLELRSLEEERVPMYVTPIKNMPKHHTLAYEKHKFKRKLKLIFLRLSRNSHKNMSHKSQNLQS